MNGPLGERIWTSRVSEELWALRPIDEEAFRTAVRNHFALGHPSFRVIRAAYPYIYIQDERGMNR
jgi:hypothetical protein